VYAAAVLPIVRLVRKWGFRRWQQGDSTPLAIALVATILLFAKRRKERKDVVATRKLKPGETLMVRLREPTS
jgi:hypothetical protein